MPFPIQEFVINRHVPNATDATSQIIFTAPYECEVVSIQSRHRVASSSGTMDLVKAADTVALSSGVSLLTATMSIAGAAATNVTGSLKTAIGDRRVPKGTSLGLVFGGTLTSLADLDVTLVVRQVRKT